MTESWVYHIPLNDTDDARKTKHPRASLVVDATSISVVQCLIPASTFSKRSGTSLRFMKPMWSLHHRFLALRYLKITTPSISLSLQNAISCIEQCTTTRPSLENVQSRISLSQSTLLEPLVAMNGLKTLKLVTGNWCSTLLRDNSPQQRSTHLFTLCYWTQPKWGMSLIVKSEGFTINVVPRFNLLSLLLQKSPNRQ